MAAATLYAVWVDSSTRVAFLRCAGHGTYVSDPFGILGESHRSCKSPFCVRMGLSLMVVYNTPVDRDKLRRMGRSTAVMWIVS